MKIDIKSETIDVSDVAVKVERTKEQKSEAYQLCVRADALRFANLHQESLSKYLRSIMIKRNNPDSYYGLGVSYKYLGNFDKAIDCLLKSAKQESKFKTYYELGICYLLNGTPEKAIESLIKAIVIEPENCEAQIQLALAHEVVGEDDLAMLIYNKLIETKPGYLKSYSHKAALLICKGKYQEASKVFSDIIKLNSNYHKAYLGIAICFENLNRYSDAKRYYKKFLELKPNSKHAPLVNTKLEKLRKKHSVSNPFARIK